MERIDITAVVSPRPMQPLSSPTPGGGGLSPSATAEQTGAPAPPAARISSFAVMWQHKDRVITQVQDAAMQRRSLARAEEATQAIEREIMAMVKNYPPFPPGSEERLSYLRSINALRQQLEALIVPPRPSPPWQIPIPPPPPVDADSDADWQMHAEAMRDYREQLGQLQRGVTELIEQARLWPELDEIVDAARIERYTLPQAARGLAGSAIPLAEGDTLARSGL